MPSIIETIVYRLDELDETAKEEARAWYRRAASDFDWHEFVFADFARICEIVGVALRTHPVRLMGGGTRSDPSIYFSGFSSQGDGACFEGSYTYGRDARAGIRAHAPSDKALHAIVDRLNDVQRRNFYQLSATVRQTGRYVHEYSMMIVVERDSPTWQAASGDDEDIVIEALRDLARWLYRQLEAEHDFHSAQPQVDEAIRANGFTFTETGRRFG
ncbi:antitoxin of toxin-antitoxin stability system [Sphingomonas echinoides]|jgi:hypothetical protein|uniref:antitoxin of toxin-antitoxin stability system n=1 Tax=Sphingomonas echinoides TaxID=59803 RepID=UPI003EEFB334